ncbi:MAG: C2 family cysteine protease [Methylobacter sp.]
MKTAQQQANNKSNRPTAEATQASWKNQSAQVFNNSKEAAAQRAVIAGINGSPRILAQRRQIESYIGTDSQQTSIHSTQPPIQRLEKPDDEEKELLQRKPNIETIVQREQQTSPKPNSTGLPDNLKSGIETLSGLSMDNVKVHYNSSQPAQLNALAYAQGTDIHIAPGQEQHLPHEAWHVVQQAQGRVKPTMQMKNGIPVNDDEGLEYEADMMGAKAMQLKAAAVIETEKPQPQQPFCDTPVQRVHPAFNSINFWRDPILNPETGEYQPHPSSPEGQMKRLTAIFGKEVAHELLHTEAEMDDAFPREKIAKDFLDNGNAMGGKKAAIMVICLKAEPADNLKLSAMLQNALAFCLANDTKPDFAETLDRAINAGQSDPKTLLPSLQQTYAPAGALIDANPKRAPKKGKAKKNSKRYQMPLLTVGASVGQVAEDIKKGEIMSVKDAFVGIVGMKDQYQVKLKLGPGSISDMWYVAADDLEVADDPILKDFKLIPFYLEGGPKVEDIQQQQLGDCYVLAAAGSILAVSPAKITNMFLDTDTDHVKVRFFKREVKDKKPYFTPEWVQVDKRLYVNAANNLSIYAKAETVLWPAILEKAYAVWKGRGGGYDPVDEGGHMNIVYQEILGKEAKSEFLFEHPFEVDENDELLKALFTKDTERTKFTKYLKDNNIAKDIKNLTDISKMVAVVNSSGITEPDKGRLLSYLNSGISHKIEEVSTNELRYGALAINFFDRITGWLQEGKPVSVGSKAWGSGGTGRSGGENTESVPGLASTHAYMILSTKTAINGRKFIQMRNPWGEFGRGYRKKQILSSSIKGTAIDAPELPITSGAIGTEITEGTFWLELSDLTKYFSQIYHG